MVKRWGTDEEVTGVIRSELFRKSDNPASGYVCGVYALVASIWQTRRMVSRWLSFKVRNSKP